MARITMFVLDDVSSDARVLREAGSLASAGHEVVIMGRPADPLSPVDGLGRGLLRQRDV